MGDHQSNLRPVWPPAIDLQAPDIDAGPHSGRWLGPLLHIAVYAPTSLTMLPEDELIDDIMHLMLEVILQQRISRR